MEKEAFNLSFNTWVRGLPDDQKNQLLPAAIRGLKNEGAKLATLQQYFKEEVWPSEIKVITE